MGTVLLTAWPGESRLVTSGSFHVGPGGVGNAVGRMGLWDLSWLH